MTRKLEMFKKLQIKNVLDIGCGLGRHVQLFAKNGYNVIIHGRDNERLEEVRGKIEKYNVKYILIDKKMTEGLIWDDQNQGLRYLLRNSETFKNSYASEGVEVWKVI